MVLTYVPPAAMIDFWNKKDDWYPTWGTPEDSSMIVSSVTMYKTC